MMQTTNNGSFLAMLRSYKIVPRSRSVPRMRSVPRTRLRLDLVILIQGDFNDPNFSIRGFIGRVGIYIYVLYHLYQQLYIMHPYLLI